jgi:hypothetical protein
LKSSAVRIAGFRRLKNKRCSRVANNQLLPDVPLSLVYPSEERLNIVVVEGLFNSMKVGGIVQLNLRTFCVAAIAIIGSTAIASAQGSTDRNGNAMGSQNVGQGTTGGTGKDNKATTGLNRTSPSQNDPNGSPSAPPSAKQGPQGDPSKANDAPK